MSLLCGCVWIILIDIYINIQKYSACIRNIRYSLFIYLFLMNTNLQSLQVFMKFNDLMMKLWIILVQNEDISKIVGHIVILQSVAKNVIVSKNKLPI